MLKKKKMLSAAIAMALVGSVGLGVSTVYAEEGGTPPTPPPPASSVVTPVQGQEVYDVRVVELPNAEGTQKPPYEITFNQPLPGGYKPEIYVNNPNENMLQALKKAANSNDGIIVIPKPEENGNIVINLGDEQSIQIPIASIKENAKGKFSYDNGTIKPYEEVSKPSTQESSNTHSVNSEDDSHNKNTDGDGKQGVEGKEKDPSKVNSGEEPPQPPSDPAQPKTDSQDGKTAGAGVAGSGDQTQQPANGDGSQESGKVTPQEKPVGSDDSGGSKGNEDSKKTDDQPKVDPSPTGSGDNSNVEKDKQKEEQKEESKKETQGDDPRGLQGNGDNPQDTNNNQEEKEKPKTEETNSAGGGSDSGSGSGTSVSGGDGAPAKESSEKPPTNPPNQENPTGQPNQSGQQDPAGSGDGGQVAPPAAQQAPVEPPKVIVLKQSLQSTVTAMSTLWMAEQNDVQKRLGELHEMTGNSGVWIRTYGGKYDMKHTNFDAKFKAIQLGYDTKVSDTWLVGVAGSHMKTDSDFSATSGVVTLTGTADTTLHGLTIYGTMQGQHNDYLDLVAKYARVKNDAHYTGIASGSAKTHGVSFSAEYGRKFHHANGVFVEPQVELTYGHLGKAHYNFKTFDSQPKHIAAEQDSMNTFTTRLGVSVGKKLENGHVFTRLSLLHRFGADANMKAGEGDEVLTTKVDLSQTWATFALGGTFKIGEATNFYANFERSFGGDLRLKWRGDLGFRYNF